MKSWSLSARIIAASVVLAVLVAGVFAVLIYAVVTLDNARERAAATKDVRTALVGLEKLVIDLETGLRGVVLTGNPAFSSRRAPRARKCLVAPVSWSASLPTVRSSDSASVNCAWRSTTTSTTTWSQLSSLPRRTWQPFDKRWQQKKPSAGRTISGRASTSSSRPRRAGGRERSLRSDAVEACDRARRRRSRRLRAPHRPLRPLSGALDCAPVREAATAATRVAEGDLSVRLSERGGEVRELTAAFNHMAEEARAPSGASCRVRTRSCGRASAVSRGSSTSSPTSSGRRLRASSASRPCSSTGTRNLRSSAGISRSSTVRPPAQTPERLPGRRAARRGPPGPRARADRRVRVVTEQVRLFEGQSEKHTLDMVIPPTPLTVNGDRTASRRWSATFCRTRSSTLPREARCTSSPSRRTVLSA